MTVQQTCEYLKAQNQILILCHQSPDGDTLGSGFGLYYALRAMGKQVRVACSDPIPPQFSFLLPQQMPDFAPQCVATVDVAGRRKWIYVLTIILPTENMRNAHCCVLMRLLRPKL